MTKRLQMAAIHLLGRRNSTSHTRSKAVIAALGETFRANGVSLQLKRVGRTPLLGHLKILNKRFTRISESAIHARKNFKIIGRHHTVEEVYQAVKYVRERHL